MQTQSTAITGQVNIRRELGLRLRELREQAGLSRSEVIALIDSEVETTLISDDSTLKRIEYGVLSVKFEQVVQIINALGADFCTILAPFFEVAREADAYEEKARLMSLLAHAEFDQFEQALNKLNPRQHRQFILYGRGALQLRKHKNNPKSKELLIEALKLTLPDVLTQKTGKVIAKKFEKADLSLTEARICADLASVYMEKGDAGFYELARHTICRSKRISKTDKESFHLAMLFNLADSYLECNPSNPYILELCQEGLSFAIEYQRNRSIHRFYYHIGKYYSRNGDRDNAKKFFQYAHDFCRLIQDHDCAEKTFKWVSEFHDITLCH